MRRVAGHQFQVVFQGDGRDERIGHSDRLAGTVEVAGDFASQFGSVEFQGKDFFLRYRIQKPLHASGGLRLLAAFDDLQQGDDSLHLNTVRLPSGGTAGPQDALQGTSFRGGGQLGEIAFGPGGEMYAGLMNTAGNYNDPEVVQLDPDTGAIERVLATRASGH